MQQTKHEKKFMSLLTLADACESIWKGHRIAAQPFLCGGDAP